MPEPEQTTPGDTIAHELLTVNWQAKRCPCVVDEASHWSAAHRVLNDLLDSWELARAEVPC